VQKKKNLRVQIVVEIVRCDKYQSTRFELAPKSFDVPPAEKATAPVSGLGPGIGKVQMYGVDRGVGKRRESRLCAAVDNPGVGQLPFVDFCLSLQTAFLLDLHTDDKYRGVRAAVLGHKMPVSTADFHLQFLEGSVRQGGQVLGLQQL
jgi:hypothetical protein